MIRGPEFSEAEIKSRRIARIVRAVGLAAIGAGTLVEILTTGNSVGVGIIVGGTFGAATAQDYLGQPPQPPESAQG